MTLDEWIEKNALGLYFNLGTHIKESIEIEHEELEDMLRLLFISIRQWDERYDKNEEKNEDK